MKHYIPRWDAIGIKKERYLELLHFCRQYPDWKTEAASLLGLHGQNMDGMPHGAHPGDPVASAAANRARLLRRIQMVEECAVGVGSGEWYAALIQHICLARPYSMLDTAILPTSDRNSFFRAKKEFFLLLHNMKGGGQNSEV